ncbi:MAG: peptidase [Candidatus Cloacimonadota bacterium]|nr:MAG: peptidase [Candidatus Cloacimonadota bacterium]
MTFILLGAVIFSFWIQHLVKSNFIKFSKVRSSSGLTGAKIAEYILAANGIHDVRVQHVPGILTDHYDPRNRTVNLSDEVYGKASVSAASIAAHETGHAIQHAKAYFPLQIRTAILPVADFGSKAAFPLIFMGIFFRISGFLDLGIIAFAAALIFQIVTLPVEFDASARALKQLSNGLITEEELTGTKKVLGAAAMTYVMSALISLIQLLRFIGIRNSRN